MAVNPQKIRVGACDSMVLFNTVDLGASTGGVELNYNATVLAVEIDQAIMPIQAYKTKEEVDFAVSLVQAQMNLVATAYAYLNATSNPVTTTAAGILNGGASTACPSLTSLTLTGTAATTTYTYQIVPFNSNGDGVPSAATGTDTTTTGPASLSASTYFTLVHPGNVSGAVGYKIWRSTGGPSQGIIGTVYGNAGFTFNDTGLAAAAGGYVAPTTNPATPNVDQFAFGNQMNVPSGNFDFSVPHNDGTSNHLRGHFYKAYSSKAIKLDFMRTKVSELSKVSLGLLADTTKPAGQQAGYLVDEY